VITARFDQRAFEKLDFTVRQIHRVILASDVKLDANLRAGNPVDTGASRASWWAMANGDPPSNPNPPAEGATGIPAGSADPAVLLASIGGILTLANDAAYIGRLNEGWSPQAPAGWVDAVANEYQDYVAEYCLQEKGATP
jgi:hypothetical protein